MENTIYITKYQFKKQVWTLTCLVPVLLLFTGCTTMNGPIVVPTDSQAQVTQEEKQKFIESCKAETEPSNKDKLNYVIKSADTYKKAGEDAGTISDMVHQDEENTGTRVGRSVGRVVGTLKGIWDVVQTDSKQKKAMSKCLEARGYEVNGWS